MFNHFRRPAILRPARASFLTIILSLATAVTAFAANPFITSIYTADPSAHVWADGRLYVYPSHDMDPPRGCDLMDRYHVFSTGDMVHWHDEGEILRASQVDWGRPKGGFMWAPDCAFKDGKYFFYFPHPSGDNWNDTWKIGVASSTSPTGGFKPVGFIAGAGGFAMIDPAVLVDTDGQAYLYYGGGGHCSGAKLKPNMVELDGEAEAMTNLVDFHEATWVFKRNNIYYLTYADNHPGNNQMRYATSTGPLGPWTYKGVYMDPTDCDTTHGSVVEFKGQWYQFYHNKSLSGQGNLRSICVDLLNFNTNGDILKLVQTKSGPPAVGSDSNFSRDTVKYVASDAALTNGATLGDDSAADGGKCIQNLHLEGSSMEFTNIDGGQSGGTYAMDIHFATPEDGKLHLTVNGEDYSFLNTFATGGWSNFTGDSYLSFPLAPGKTNVIRLTGGNGGVNVNYVSFTPLSPAHPAEQAGN
jgi:hypothetical protein